MNKERPKSSWEIIEECAKEWKMVEIYYRRKYDETNIRYELVPISKRGHLIYFYNPAEDKTKRFVETRIRRAAKMEKDPPFTREEAPYPVEIGVDDSEREDDGTDMP